jgi:hypothetical protein
VRHARVIVAAGAEMHDLFHPGLLRDVQEILALRITSMV